MKPILKFSLLLTFAVCLCVFLSGCFSFKYELSLEHPISDMKVGEEQELTVYRESYITRRTPVETNELTFASSNPGIATVNRYGKIQASSQGTVIIYIQDTKTNSKTELTINVKYDVISAPKYNIQNADTAISGDSYPFWREQDHKTRVDNWDVLDVAKIIIDKDKNEYVFSEAFNHLLVTGEEICLIADWGNSDVTIDKNLLDQISIQDILPKYELDSHLNNGGINFATAYIQSEISNIIETYQGTVKLSVLPTDQEYRVYLTTDYNIAKVLKYYSRGKLSGIWQLGKDIVKGDVKSLLDSYTYSEHEYELIDCSNVSLVIESRIP